MAEMITSYNINFSPRLPDATNEYERQLNILLLSLFASLNSGLNASINTININDTWRIQEDGANLVFQKYESGSWVTKDTIIP